MQIPFLHNLIYRLILEFLITIYKPTSLNQQIHMHCNIVSIKNILRSHYTELSAPKLKCTQTGIYFITIFQNITSLKFQINKIAI